MSSRTTETAASYTQGRNSNAYAYAAYFLAAIALIYALLAGLHTLQDFDFWWQLATGRWVAQHHRVFSTDIFSYTAHGAPWIYPVVSGLIFYAIYVAGSYAALSWMGAAVCASTVALLLRRKNIATCALALIAVPLIANRTQPRAEMFTTILFAAFLSLLWQHYRSWPGRSEQRRSTHSWLWLLPILMIAWVNLHPGFIAGLALCGAYLLLEILDFPFSENRHDVRRRLKQAWPWLALTAVATFLNPWGIFIYRALALQQQAQSLHNVWVVEWESIRPSWSSFHQALAWRDPQSVFWWLLAIALLCALIALWRKHLGAAALLLGSAYLSIQHVRFQALFACVAAVLGGSLLEEAWVAFKKKSGLAKSSRAKSKASWPKTSRFGWSGIAVVLFTAALASLTAVRSADLVTNRYYLKSSELSLFGSGLSWWYPERAIDFLRREKLPPNIFNGYALGGYLTWRLFPEYSDYIDSRAVPFGPELFFKAYDLSIEPPESAAWRQEADAHNINTIVVSLARYDGIALFPQLRAFCQSETWRPVYMDEISAVFVRRTAQTASLVDRLQIDCDKVSFAPPPKLQAAESSANLSSRNKAELFNFWANSAEVLYSVGRYQEAQVSLDRAQSIFSENANLHWIQGLLLERSGKTTEAEAEFLASLRIEPSDQTWTVLGLSYMAEKRYTNAIEIFRRSAESSSRPHDLWMLLGQAYLQTRQPQPALDAFDKAEASSPFRAGTEALGARFNSMVATGRAKAWYQMGDTARAVSYQEEAVRIAPDDARLWSGLADLYQAEGRTAEAEQARSHTTQR
ncbi:MAG: tetratricopeptide repeat protein [Candidatus Sulfotelmatobacter sp.]